MKTKHTPGPWYLVEDPEASTPFQIARASGKPFPHAIEKMRGQDGEPLEFETKDEARAAIAKATGDQS